VPEPYLQAIDELVKKRFYPNRAELIRIAIRDLLSREAWKR
jgi:Arc/MetJ-type ribon-helix-helix transcriptional regulator